MVFANIDTSALILKNRNQNDQHVVQHLKSISIAIENIQMIKKGAVRGIQLNLIVGASRQVADLITPLLKCRSRAGRRVTSAEHPRAHSAPNFIHSRRNPERGGRGSSAAKSSAVRGCNSRSKFHSYNDTVICEFSGQHGRTDIQHTGR